jgi:rod shape-determining protein MreC
MSLRDGPLNDIKPPLTWLAVAALSVAGIIAVVVFVGDRRGALKQGPTPARHSIDGALSLAGGTLSAPVRWVGGVSGAARDYLLAGAEVSQLRAELVAARTWRDQAIALRDENARYRALLAVGTDPPLPKVFAHTVLDARGPFANTRIADVGAARGVSEGNPVLSDHGLVGRVTGVARDACRILLLTDVDSRTPVLIARTNGRAILTGDGGGNPRLNYLRTHDALREGDRVLTSGDGGVLPRGLPVGVVVKGFDNGWRVELDSDASPIDFVQIMLFQDFSQLTLPTALDPKTLPPIATGAPAQAAPAMATSQDATSHNATPQNSARQAKRPVKAP